MTHPTKRKILRKKAQNDKTKTLDRAGLAKHPDAEGVSGQTEQGNIQQ